MSVFTLEIKTDSAAFQDDDGWGFYEVARLLREVADRVEGGWSTGGVLDLNGNTVGAFDWRGRP